MAKIELDAREKLMTKVTFILIAIAISIWGAITLKETVAINTLTQETVMDLLTGLGVVTLLLLKGLNHL